MTKPAFLTAQWRKLIMANYAIDASILKEFLPTKTEIDFFNGNCYVSLVGFLFQDVRVKGFKIPFHINFEEVNLRFYVKFKENGIWKRGVVFIKEIVPKPAISFVANTLYREKYETMPMNHRFESNETSQLIEYQWKKNQKLHSISIETSLNSLPIEAGSEEEFITEHYWGYTKINEKTTSEYGVEHPRWEVYPIKNYQIDVNFSDIYGEKFGFLQNQKPNSVFLAEGSEIVVRKGKKI